jgi:hypothetical protein
MIGTDGPGVSRLFAAPSRIAATNVRGLPEQLSPFSGLRPRSPAGLAPGVRRTSTRSSTVIRSGETRSPITRFVVAGGQRSRLVSHEDVGRDNGQARTVHQARTQCPLLVTWKHATSYWLTACSLLALVAEIPLPA